jgi:tyrosine decarboxylase/aspartate 1-decarboxylase
MTETGHYSFRLAGELFGVRVKVAPVKPDLSPMMGEVEGLINENTVMLISSAPEGSLGVVDPVKEFGELAEKHGLYLHVDAAVGGFILPFMRELGYNVPPFDFRVPQVISMIPYPHKLGMQQKPTSSFIIRDRAYLEAIPVEETLIPYLSGTSRMGASAASLWALIRYLGKDGYKRYVSNAMDLTNVIVKRIKEIGGLELVRQPTISVLGLISNDYDIRKVEKKVAAEGWVTPVWTLLHTQKPYMRIFVHPLKTKEIVESYLEDLEMAVNTVKSEA